MMVDTDQIFLAKRYREDYGDLNSLAASMKAEGQLQNLVVRPPNEGEDTEGRPWVVIAGGRRYTAALIAGIPSLRVIVKADLPEWRQLALELEENIQRKDMTWQEQDQLRRKIHEIYSAHNPDWDQKDTARLLRVDAATVTRSIAAAKAIEKDPVLANASSRKQVIRMAEVRQHVEVQRAQAEAIASKDFRDLYSRLEVGDMRAFLRRLELASVDLHFADLPYGIDIFDLPTDTNIQNNGGVSKFDDSWESIVDLYTDIVPELVRSTKMTGWIVLMSSFEGCELLRDLFEDVCDLHCGYKNEEPDYDGRFSCNKKPAGSICTFPIQPEAKHWIWYRPNSRNNSQYPDRHAANDYENILVVNRGRGRIVTADAGTRVSNIIVCDVDTNKLHPHQKPAGLCEEIVKRLTVSNHLVVDCCYGSGSALRAAARLGRQIRGCDSNELHRDIAVSEITKVLV